MAKPLSEAELQRVYHHTFLPPELPQASDDTTDVNIHLINVTIEALRAYKQLLPDESPSSLENAIVAIQNLKFINSLEHGATSESELLRVLSGLCDGQSAPMRIRQQNAAVLVTKNQMSSFSRPSSFRHSTQPSSQSKADSLARFPAPQWQ
jgi:hypothetical protein